MIAILCSLIRQVSEVGGAVTDSSTIVSVLSLVWTVISVGSVVIGSIDGACVGSRVGSVVGFCVGAAVCARICPAVCAAVGLTVGATVGAAVDSAVGFTVGKRLLSSTELVNQKQ